MLGAREFDARQRLVMAILNRTPDSFYDSGATWDEQAALDRVEQVLVEGADIVDVGGVKAGAGPAVSVAEEIDRVVPFVSAVRAAHPSLLISVDTWRAEVGRAACEAGADLLNDAWGGYDPELAEVAAAYDVALVCSHTGGAVPRSVPRRVCFDDVVEDAVRTTVGLAERAVALGVDKQRLLIDPAHDFGKNTLHSLELTRRLDELTATGWPVLVSVSHKDFVGETLDLPLDQRVNGTLAATAVCAWHGAMVFRAHQVAQTRQVLDMVSAIAGDRPPARLERGID